MSATPSTTASPLPGNSRTLPTAAFPPPAAPSLSPTASSHTVPSMPSSSSSHPNPHLQQQQQHNASISSGESNERQIAEARAFLHASMSNIGSSLDKTLQERAKNLHDNSKVLERQQKEVGKATEGLRKENEKLGKMAAEGSRKVKELGNVQNWAEMLERDFLVLGEWVRLVDKGSESEWESSSSYTGSESGGEEAEERSRKDDIGKEINGGSHGSKTGDANKNTDMVHAERGAESIEEVATSKDDTLQVGERRAHLDADGDLQMQEAPYDAQPMDEDKPAPMDLEIGGVSGTGGIRQDTHVEDIDHPVPVNTAKGLAGVPDNSATTITEPSLAHPPVECVDSLFHESPPQGIDPSLVVETVNELDEVLPSEGNVVKATLTDMVIDDGDIHAGRDNPKTTGELIIVAIEGGGASPDLATPNGALNPEVSVSVNDSIH